MKKFLKIIISLLFGLYILASAFLYIVQRDVLFRPNTAKPDSSLLPVEEINVETEDGLSLLSWWYQGDYQKPTILYFQGNAGNLDYQVNLTGDLIKANYNVLMLGYRGYGSNKGEPSELGLYTDARAAINWLNTQNIKTENIIFYGRSLGSGVATKMASEVEAAGLILQAPYTRITDIGQERYWWLPVALVAKDHFNNIDTIKFVDEPVFVFWGDQDRVVPPSHAAAVYAAANEPKGKIVISGGGHSDIYQIGGNAALLDWLDQQFPASERESAEIRN